MAGNRPIGGTFEDVGETINQSVVKPVTDEVGKAIEAGIQSVVGGQSVDPQQKSFDSAQDKQQKNLEDQEKIAEWRWKLQKLKELEEAQRKVREEEKQKSLDYAQDKQEEQDKKEKTEVKKFEVFKKQKEVNPEIAAKGKAEIKRGVGG